jgi:hypothetical protein
MGFTASGLAAAGADGSAAFAEGWGATGAGFSVAFNSDFAGDCAGAADLAAGAAFTTGFASVFATSFGSSFATGFGSACTAGFGAAFGFVFATLLALAFAVGFGSAFTAGLASAVAAGVGSAIAAGFGAALAAGFGAAFFTGFAAGLAFAFGATVDGADTAVSGSVTGAAFSAAPSLNGDGALSIAVSTNRCDKVICPSTACIIARVIARCCLRDCSTAFIAIALIFTPDVIGASIISVRFDIDSASLLMFVQEIA